MPSTIGHALAGVVVYQLLGERSWGRPWSSHASPTPDAPEPHRGPSRTARFALAAIVANVPDLDFVLSYLALGTARPMHGTITHSIAFAVLGALALAYFRWFGDYRRSAILGLALLGSHAVMDWLAGPSVGRSTGIGVMLLYPFSLERFGAPLKLFIGPRHRTLEALLSLHNVIAVLWEVLLLAPVAAWLEWRRRRDVP